MELRRYCDRDLDATSTERVGAHLRDCDFCREFCQEYRALVESIDDLKTLDPSPEAPLMADRLFRESRWGLAISLAPFVGESMPEVAHLAADGEEATTPRLENLGTFFSEQPEIVLRVMRDNRQGRDYLQLVGEDTAAIAHVLVRVPELDMSVLTDEHGKGELDRRCPDDVSTLDWQIKMPEVEFSLSPLYYDPQKVEYAEDIVLETDREDRVSVRFEGRTEGKRISVRILQLNGRTDFEPISVAVFQGEKAAISGSSVDSVVDFEIADSQDSIEIRLFRP